MKHRLLVVFSPLLVLLLYARVFGFEFVWDDWYLITIPVYESLDLLAVMTTPGNGVHYLPVRDVTLLLDTLLFGSDAGGFHLANVVWFVLATGLLHLLYRNLFLRSSIPKVEEHANGLALACALVFAAHPLQVESVAFVSARNGILALLFGVSGILSYDRFLTRGGWCAYGASLLLAAAALLSKQSAVTLPGLLVLLHLHRAKGDGVARAIRSLAPHLALGAGVAVLHLAVARSAGIVGSELSPLALLARLPRAAFVAEFYVWKFAWPVGLTIEYDLTNMLQQRVLFGLGALFLAGVWLGIVVREHRTRSLWWLLAWCYPIALLPVMNLLPAYPPVADRYALFPLVTLCPLILVPALIRLPPAGCMAATAILVAGLSLLTSLQLSNWRNDETLLTHAVQMNPGATHALGNLALVLGERGRHDEALRVAETLGRLQPEGFHGDYLRGLRAFQEGRRTEAEAWLETATKKEGHPRFISWAALGQVYEQRSRPEAARRAYSNALDRLSGQPHYASQRRKIEERLRHLQLRRR